MTSILTMGHACSSSMQRREHLEIRNRLASSLLVTLTEHYNFELDDPMKFPMHS